MRARQRKRRLRVDRRGEPFASVQPPAAVFLARDGFGAGDIRTAGVLRHPLPADPELLRIAAQEMRQCAFDQFLVLGGLDRGDGAVGHRQRARVELARAMEQIHHRELMHARVRAVRRFVTRRDDAVLRRQRLRGDPCRREFETVDAFAPRIPLRQLRFAAFAQRADRPRGGGEFAEFGQVVFDGAEHGRRQHAAQIGTQHAVVEILVAQNRRGLQKGHRVLPWIYAKATQAPAARQAVSGRPVFCADSRASPNPARRSRSARVRSR